MEIEWIYFFGIMLLRIKVIGLLYRSVERPNDNIQTFESYDTDQDLGRLDAVV